jgi:transposase
MCRLGEDMTDVLDYVPASFKVVRHVRPKLPCRVCETIVQAPICVNRYRSGTPAK